MASSFTANTIIADNIYSPTLGPVNFPFGYTFISSDIGTPGQQGFGVGVALGAYTFGVGEEAELLAFGAHCEAARASGNVEKAKFGL
jgi:hypothetical protein